MMRLRLQMLAPASDRCSWNRRISSVVAVSGDRFRNVANCLQLRMWPLCVPAQSLRAFMSSIMRWRNGVTDSVLIGKLLSWLRLKTPRSSRQGAPPAIDDLYSVTVPQIVSRLSGLSRSDLVRWHFASFHCTAILRPLSDLKRTPSKHPRVRFYEFTP